MTSQEIIDGLEQYARRLAGKSKIVSEFTYSYGFGVMQQTVLDLLTDPQAKIRILRILEGKDKP